MSFESVPDTEFPVEFGGYAILHKPLPEGYGERVGDPGYKGEYERVVAAFEVMDPEVRQSYIRIAAVAIDPPAQEPINIGIFGFSAKDYAIYLAQGAFKADPEVQYENVTQTIAESLNDLSIWHNVQRSMVHPPILCYVQRDRDIPDSADWFWVYGSRNHFASEETMDEAAKVIEMAQAYCQQRTSGQSFEEFYYEERQKAELALAGQNPEV